MTRAGFPRVHLEAACTGSEMTTPRRYYTRIDETSNYANDIADELDAMFKSDRCDWDLVREAARVLRLCQAPATKPTAPRILQSPDEAPCGSLLIQTAVSGALRLWNGRAWNLECGGGLPETSNGHKGPPELDDPVTLIAEGLTEPECRHLSGLSVADAIAWCSARATAQGAAK